MIAIGALLGLAQAAGTNPVVWNNLQTARGGGRFWSPAAAGKCATAAGRALVPRVEGGSD